MVTEEQLAAKVKGPDPGSSTALGAEVDIDGDDESHVESFDDEIVQVAETDYTFDELKAMGQDSILELVMKTKDPTKKAYYVQAMKILIESDKKRKRSGSPNESGSKKAKLEKAKRKKGKESKDKLQEPEKASSSNTAPKVDDKKPKKEIGSSMVVEKPRNDAKPKEPGEARSSIAIEKPRDVKKPKFFTCAKSLSEKNAKFRKMCLDAKWCFR